MQAQKQQQHILRTPQEIYSTSDNHQKLSYFYNSNKIISSSHIVLDILRNFNLYSIDNQQKILNELIIALKSVTTNSYTLNQQAKGRRNIHINQKDLLQGYEEHNKDIISIVISLLIANVKNYIIFNLLLQILEELFLYSSLEEELLNPIISKLTVNYYQSKVYASQLFVAASIFKSFYHAKVSAEKDARNMMVFHGGTKVEILPMNNKPLTWIFKQGFTLCFWINLENIKSGIQNSLPKLFTFYAPENGGIESYLIDSKIYYRILGAKYTEPQIGSNGIFLGQLQVKKWNFICFEHEGHHTFQKSKLKCYINKNKPNIVGLDPPKISSTTQTKYIFFDNIYCRTSSVCLVPYILGQQNIEEYNKNINSLQNVKNPKAYVFEIRQGIVYQRTGLGLSHNYIFERGQEMNFQLVLPIFYLLRYQQKDQNYPTLNELLSSLVLFLRKSQQNQAQSVKNCYFKQISQLICDIDKNIFDQNTIKSILYIKHTITDQNLLDQYYSDFLWPLLYASIPIIRKEQVLQIIKNAFTQNIAHYSTQIGLDQMINLLQKIEGGILTCCQKHFKIASNKFDKYPSSQTTFGQQKKAQGYIFSLIENTFQNSKIHYAQQIYKLCRLFVLKFSPCFLLELMNLIKRLLNQKFNERMSQSQTKQISKYFQQKKIHYIFLNVIQNNFFAEIKAQSVKLIYYFFIKRSSAEESHISFLISKILWKINQFAEEKEEVQYKAVKIQENQVMDKYVSNKKTLLQGFQEENNKQFVLVGPQAPILSNRLKGKKSFDFGFVNQAKTYQDRQIMQQEKTAQPQNKLTFSLKQPPKKKKLALHINTQQINQMYTFGGENGQQIIISQDQQKLELQKIIYLTKKCVNKMKGSTMIKEQPKEEFNVSKNTYVVPPMTTKNKVAISKKNFNLNFISEEQQQVQVRIPTPLATRKSSKTPTSIKNSNDQNLFILYNNLLQCCLGVSFQTSLISNTKIQVPTILSIFFKWIPQTDLQTKFLNDLEIILQSSQNIAVIVQLPELYDFLLELSYKCLLFQQMKEKRVYTQKLQTVIKIIFNYIYKEDLNGLSKFSFILNWIDSKKDQHYQPKCLFFTGRYIILLILQQIQELLLTKHTNDQVMQRNFQSLSLVIDSLKKLIPDGMPEIIIDDNQRVIFNEEVDIPLSLVPYFKTQWVDFVLYQKYLFIFKRFYCTEWYQNGLKYFYNKDYNLLDYLRKFTIPLLNKQSTYYMRNNFLVSLIEIHRAMLIQIIKTQPKEVQEYGQESVWQTILLVIFVQFNKDIKGLKNHRSQIILTFLKSCKILAQKDIEKIVDIVPMLSMVKHYLTLSSPQSKPITSTQILDDIIGNYIPEYLLKMDKNDLQTFILHFSQVWIPNENQYKKFHSQLFLNYKEKQRKDEDNINFIEFVSNNIQEQNERRQFTNIILEANDRSIKNQFRKIWYQLRVYGTIWTHPNFKWQEDKLFTKSTYDYERYQPSIFYKYKIAKQYSKGKARYFLKPRLSQPSFKNQKYLSKIKEYEQQFNLQKALKVMNDKLMIGLSKKSWILPKGQENLTFIMNFKAVKIINTLTFRSGYLAIINDNIIFISSTSCEKISHYAIDQYKLRNDKTMQKLWPLEYIREIYKRRYVNKKKSIQINFIYNKSVLFDFQSEEEAEDFTKKIMKLKNKCINLSFIGKSLDPKKLIEAQEYTKKWTHYQMPTLDYLMQLNTLAGRSYSDLTQYPVVPWTLTNFKEEKCNVRDPRAMRNLALPMGANGTEDRIDNFKERYQIMQMQDEYSTKFHYGTHYSSPGIIYHFLVRLSPYTEGSILLQSGKFDFADRLFFSLEDSYKNAISQYSDVRQLIPELYTIPEAYLNINGLNLGVMQNKKRVHNLELPQWSLQNPYNYVYYLKKCIQQDVASAQMNNWIDLIFGYKQKGQEAIKSLNCFYYLTYEDAVPWQNLQKQKDIQSIQSQIVNFGQTPSQIFSKAHPSRGEISNTKNFKMICDAESQPKVYRPSKNTKQLSNEEKQLNPLKQIDNSIIFMKWISQSKLVFIRKSGQIVYYKCQSYSNSQTKIPFQCTIEKQKKVDKLKKVLFDPSQFYDPSLNILSFPIDIIASGHIICLGGLSDGKLILIDIDTNTTIQMYNNHSHTISCVKSDPRQNFLITGDIKGKVIFWQIKTNSNNISKLVEKKVIRDSKQQITSIYYSLELQCIAISSMDGRVYIYNMITGKKLRVYYHPKRYPIDQVIITSNPVAAVILFCNTQNTIYSYSLNGQLIARVHEKSFQSFLTPIIIKDSKHFQYLAFGNEKSEIIIRGLPFLQLPKKSVFKVSARDACVNKISISKYSRYLFSGCSDGQLTVITDPRC